MSTNADHILEGVRDAVLAAGGERVARIVAYGSRVGGKPRPDSDLDLLIVLFDEPDRDLGAELRRAVDEAAPWPVNAWIVSERKFEETKEMPGGMTFAPHRHGVVLFRHPASPQRYDDLRSREEVRGELAGFWIRRAAGFLETGRTLLRWGGDSCLDAARNARWAAEWYLRGYFTAHGIDTGKVHGFRQLRRHVAHADPELAEALAVADPLTRYPRPFDLGDRSDVVLSEEEARDALRRAERVGALVEERLAIDHRRSGAEPGAEGG